MEESILVRLAIFLVKSLGERALKFRVPHLSYLPKKKMRLIQILVFLIFEYED